MEDVQAPAPPPPPAEPPRALQPIAVELMPDELGFIVQALAEYGEGALTTIARLVPAARASADAARGRGLILGARLRALIPPQQQG